MSFRYHYNRFNKEGCPWFVIFQTLFFLLPRLEFCQAAVNFEPWICKIQQLESEKDLGVTFDDKWTFNKHIHLKVNIANRNLGLNAKSFTYLDKEMFLQLYKALGRPHLEYASVIWNPRYEKDIIVIEMYKERATN